MIGVDEATRLIGDSVRILPEETVPLTDAGGRVLRGPVVADRDVPPFDRVMMDGIALAHPAFRSGRRSFTVQGEIAAGHPPIPLPDPTRDCLEVMTGAVLPPGCDCVIPVEEIDFSGGEAAIREGVAVEAEQFIHRRGSDRPQGDVLLRPGCRLNAARIGIAASAGCAELTVTQRPVIGIVSSGDELVDLDRPIEPHQIRPSNRYALRAALLHQGFEALHTVHLPDDEARIEQKLRPLLATCDITVLSGGVSAGAHDYIPDVLDRLGVQRVFHKVRQRPGKPMWFGITRHGRPVFALPGNPVSTFMCFHRYVLPHLHQMLQTDPRVHTAIVGEPMTFAPPLTGLFPVRAFDAGDGRRTAIPITYHGSGDLTALDQGTGFVELVAEQKEFPAGTAVPYYSWS